MKQEVSGRRYLCLWLPFLSADRWQRERAAHSPTSGTTACLVFAEAVHGAMRVSAVNAAARDKGLLPGLPLADARARHPTLSVVERDFPADRIFLEHLADLATAFTPSVALDEPDGLALDITGCAHLFGGETELAARLQTTFRYAGVTACRLAAAPTPDMARALARFAHQTPCFTHDQQRVEMLPVAALECNAEDTATLRRAGLKTIGELARRPSALFTARFTKAFVTKLARVLGEEDRHITPRHPRSACKSEHRCAEPVIGHDVVGRILSDLATSVSAQLRARGAGGRLFESTFLRTDGAIKKILIETSRATREPDVLLRLHQDRLDALADPLDCGFGLDLIRLEVLRSEPFDEIQSSLDAHDDATARLTHLSDRLSAMFGRERVARLQPANTHIPERAQTVVPACDTVSTSKWLHHKGAGGAAPRPILLYPHPHPIEVRSSSCAPHGGPLNFWWRRIEHTIVHFEGPERIADEWWGAQSGYGTRDYYRVASNEGRRFWIFRSGSTAPSAQQKWFLHGMFA